MQKTWMQTRNYTRGRSGQSVVAIVPHISCCKSIGAIDNTFGPYSSRKVSTHYAVSARTIHQYVSESDTAWSVGNWPWNCKTISIEHVGTVDNPPTYECLDMGAQLMAEIAKRYGWDRLELGTNVRLHREFAATSCPANMNYEWEIERANEYLAGSSDKKKKRGHDMEMLFYIKGEGGTRYLCGTNQHVLNSPEEQAAIETAYRKCYGEEIPHVVLDKVTGKNFIDALS